MTYYTQQKTYWLFIVRLPHAYYPQFLPVFEDRWVQATSTAKCVKSMVCNLPKVYQDLMTHFETWFEMLKKSAQHIDRFQVYFPNRNDKKDLAHLHWRLAHCEEKINEMTKAIFTKSITLWGSYKLLINLQDLEERVLHAIVNVPDFEKTRTQLHMESMYQWQLGDYALYFFNKAPRVITQATAEWARGFAGVREASISAEKAVREGRYIRNNYQLSLVSPHHYIHFDQSCTLSTIREAQQHFPSVTDARILDKMKKERYEPTSLVNSAGLSFTYQFTQKPRGADQTTHTSPPSSIKDDSAVNSFRSSSLGAPGANRYAMFANSDRYRLSASTKTSQITVNYPFLRQQQFYAVKDINTRAYCFVGSQGQYMTRHFGGAL